MTQSVPAKLAARRVARTTDEVGNRVRRQLPVRKQLLRLLPAALAILALSACASSEYMGISFKPGAAASDLQELARRAQAGDKQAQLELGIRFEEGNGIPADKGWAIQLYRRAAMDSGGTMWVYMPSPGNSALAKMTPVHRGRIQTGLKAAKARLASLEKDSNE